MDGERVRKRDAIPGTISIRTIREIMLCYISQYAQRKHSTTVPALLFIITHFHAELSSIHRFSGASGKACNRDNFEITNYNESEIYSKRKQGDKQRRRPGIN
jgi:hypothetical protein